MVAPLRIVTDVDPTSGEGMEFDAFFATESHALLRRLWLVTRDSR